MGANLTYPRVQLPHACTVIVTGANSGIGYETAKAIAEMGARVIIACRSEIKAMEAIERMKQEYQESAADKPQEDRISLQLEFMKLDLGSLQSTMEFIEAFKNTGYPLHILVCNAGIAFVPFELTEDGHEKHFQVNFLSHLLIILHLLPVLKTSGTDPRLILVSSGAYKWAQFSLENIEGKVYYSPTSAYNNSKLYQVMLMHDLGRRLQGTNTTVMALNPGLVATEILNNNPSNSLLMRAIRAYVTAAKSLGMIRSCADGAATTINCAVNPTLAGAALYFNNCQEEPTKPHARDEKAQAELLNYCLGCLKDYLTEDILQEFPIQELESIDEEKQSNRK